MTETLLKEPEIVKTNSVGRLVSIDFLRGITIASMILVNSPGSWDYVYPSLLHAQWNGCTYADLVFPFFLFLVGVSIHLSLSKAKNSEKGRKDLLMKIFKRGLILFALGLFLNGFPYFELHDIRIPGVLQRISLVFTFSAILYVLVPIRSLVFITSAFLLGYWAIMTLLPVPGIGPANLGPETNIGAWLDRLLLDGHLWKLSKTWDPEGILGTIPAIASGLIGILTGTVLTSSIAKLSKVYRFLIIGFTCIIAGLIWDLYFPINKALWTSSYVLLTSGIAAIALGISYFIIDVKEYKGFTSPFIAFGSNAIVAYMLAELGQNLLYTITVNTEGGNVISLKNYLFNGMFQNSQNLDTASLIFAVAYVLLIFIPLYIMNRKKIFVKV